MQEYNFFKHQSSYQQSLILLCKVNTNIEGVLQQKKDYLNKEEQNKYNSSYKKEFETSRTCITGTLKAEVIVLRQCQRTLKKSINGLNLNLNINDTALKKHPVGFYLRRKVTNTIVIIMADR